MSVVVVGSINQDTVVRVGRIPSPGETVLASAMVRTAGGKGANQAVAARRAGREPVAFVGAVGNDGEGATLRNALIEDGIDVSGLSRVDGPSGMALICVDDTAENTIVVVPGANAVPSVLNAAQRSLVEAAIVVLTQLEIRTELVQEAAALRNTQAWHVLNAAPSGPLVTDGAVLLPLVDVLVVNEHEALDASGVNDLDAAVAALAPRVRALILTLGPRGSLVVCGDERMEVPALAVDPVDTTGAGDTFCGVFAATLGASGRSPQTVDIALLAQAARAGAAAAALAVTRPGAQNAVPTADEVAAFIERTNA
ncbi:ribokinase [Arthrobacter sp. UYP6]|uniref:ribokinase n=1 Tax=Arthrobacter sp. UYP6 TaxID=1756378 RepID=UPI00339750DA